MIETGITASCRNGYEVRGLGNACNPESRRQEDAVEFEATLGYTLGHTVNSSQAGKIQLWLKQKQI